MEFYHRYVHSILPSKEHWAMESFKNIYGFKKKYTYTT